MAIEFEARKLSGSRFTEEAPNKFTLEEIYLCTGVDGSAIDKYWNIREAAGYPTLYTAAPGTGAPIGLVVLKVDVEPIPGSPTKYKVIAHYGIPAVSPLEGTPRQVIGSTCRQDETFQGWDESNNPVQITTQHDPDKDPIPTGVVFMEPNTTWRFQRLETAGLFLGNQFYLSHVPAINDAEWHGAKTGSLLCTAVNGESTDGGYTYSVSYEFQYRNKEFKWPGNEELRYYRWHPVVCEKDDATGRPKKDLVWGEGVKMYRIFPWANFDEFGF